MLTRHTSWVTSVSFTSNGKRIGSGSNDKSARVWEHEGNKWISEVLTRNFDVVTRVNISANGKRIVSGSDNESVQLWEFIGNA